MIFFKHTWCWQSPDPNEPRGWFLSSCGTWTIMVRKRSRTLHNALLFAVSASPGKPHSVSQRIKGAAIAVATWRKKLGGGAVCAAALHKRALGRLTPPAALHARPVVSGHTRHLQRPRALGRAGCGHGAPAPCVLIYQDPQQKGGIIVMRCKGKTSSF